MILIDDDVSTVCSTVCSDKQTEVVALDDGEYVE